MMFRRAQLFSSNSSRATRRPASSPRLARPQLELLEDRNVLSTLLAQEALVNTYTTNIQENADIDRANDGSFVVVWQSQGQDGSGWGIYGQRYDAAGNKVGNEFLVNTTTAGDQLDPAVAVDADGDFVVVWGGNGSVPGVSGTFLDQFNSQNYNLSNGTVAWPGPWLETSDNGTSSPTSGQIQIANDTVATAGNMRLRILGGTNQSPTIQRPVNIAGATTATLSFNYRRVSLENNDFVYVQTSSDGNNWATVFTITNGSNDAAYLSSGSIAISTATTYIRFAGQALNSSTDTV
ncbi:MAG: hypothetical protein AB7K24_07050, partial [Gemmataceae bacterium]